MFHIDQEKIQNHCLKDVKDIFQGNFFRKHTGEHYKLLSYLSDQLEDALILDIGTASGYSAVALAAHAEKHNNFIVTCDVVDIRKLITGRLPIQYLRVDCNSQLFWYLAPQAELIFLDINHRGRDEMAFYQMCKETGFKGLMVCDDIKDKHGLKHPLRRFWRDVDLPKYDLTDFCHWSGTGLIDFGIGVTGVEADDSFDLTS